MSVIHSIKKSLLEADGTRERLLLDFLDEDIRSENTFVYLKSEILNAELVISSGEIKVYDSLSIKNKIITVHFLEPIKPYGKCEPLLDFVINLKNKNSNIITFPSTKNLDILFSEFVLLEQNDKKRTLKKKENKLIFNHELAKFLIHQGFRVIDTKKDRHNDDNWIPVFLVDEGFYESIEMFERMKDFSNTN